MKKRKSTNKKQGLKFFRKKQWVRAVSSLEKALREDNNDHEIYLYLGYASLFSADLDGARRYMKSGLLIKEDDEDLLKGLAYIYLKDDRIEDAISLWGEILEKNPKDRMIKRSLERLRETEDIANFIENARHQDFLSLKAPFAIKFRPYLMSIGITLGMLALGILFYTTPAYKLVLEKFYPEIAELERFTLSGVEEMSQPETEGVLYSFTDQEIESGFVRIKRYIYKGKINTAIISLNKLMLSNASPVVKEKLKILYTFLDPPDDPRAIDYNPRYYEIVKEPSAFKGVYVLWKGRIANLEREKDAAYFDLLVNYEDEDTIEGIVHVRINGVYRIENRQKIELFGAYEGYDRETGNLLINGLLLRDLRI